MTTRRRRVLSSIALAWAVAVAVPAAAAPGGWRFHAGQPGKPAVLLIHGLAASSRHWTDPASTWSIKGSHYDHRKTIEARSGISDVPRIGVQSFSLSPQDDGAGAAGSFWTYLTGKGYTVATWDQTPCMDEGERPTRACLGADTFDAVYPSAKAALAELARLSGPTTPIALVGHSRGGLVARRLLKEKAQPGLDRVHWLITLHTPHQGTSIAAGAVAVQKKVKQVETSAHLDVLPGALRRPAKKLLRDVAGGLGDAIEMIVEVAGTKGARELATNGPVVESVRAGETKPPGVRVVTFGGTSPRVVRLYAWVYTAGSAVPSSEGFRWTAEPHEVLDVPEGLGVPFDEMKRGGDMLVTDASSRLRWEDAHFANPLNHAEVLWDRAVQAEVEHQMTLPP